MPEKRSGTHRINVFLTDDAYQNFTNYISTNYSAADSYGVKSEVANAAISCYCSNVNNKASCGVDPSVVLRDFMNNVNKELGLEEEVKQEEFKETLDRVIEEHKETLDKLADTPTDDDAQWRKTYPDAEEERLKAEYEAECAAAQNLAQAEDEGRWQEEQEENDRREAENQGLEGDEEI